VPFNSLKFLFVFLPAVILLYGVCLRVVPAKAKICLTAISVVFYISFSTRQALTFLLPSVALNFWAARLLAGLADRPKLQTKWLTAFVSVNILALVYFKYTLWALEFAAPSSVAHNFAATIIAPLGVSFVTLIQIGYLVEVKQGTAKVVDFFGYCVCAFCFCHVISGPIIHIGEIYPQLPDDNGAQLRWNEIVVGSSWFVMGLFKKVVIADSITPWADYAFGHPREVSALGASLGVITFAMQIYFDFSGYSDMALGLGRMFGLRYPFNFNSPFQAASIIDYWSRWHMSLTRYITAFLYNPMSAAASRKRAAQGKPIGKRGAKTISGFAQMIAVPTLVTMTIVGVWHGAGMPFLIFGVLHGVYLALNNAWRIFNRREWFITKVISYRPVSVAITFVAALFGFLFWRAASASDAFAMLSSVCGAHGLIGAPADGATLLSVIPASVVRLAPALRVLGAMPVTVTVLALLPIVWFMPNTQEILGQSDVKSEYVGYAPQWLTWRPAASWAWILGGALAVAISLIGRTSNFVYFKI